MARSVVEGPALRSTVAFAGVLLLACARAQASESPDVFPVATPGRAASHYEREYVGDVEAIQRAELRARIKGRVEPVAFDEGQTVRAGQLLFSISARELQQELRRARAAVASAAAELKAAEIERRNTRMLLERSVVSSAEMALVESRIQLLTAKLEEAKAAEGQAAIEVRAPFDGVVNRVEKKAGTLVAEGDLLTIITNAAQVFVYFRVSEQEYLQYVSKKEGEPGKEVSFRLANGDILPSEGVLDAVETEFDRSTGTIAFRARFDNRANLLRHGSSGKVIVKTRVDDAVTIPQRATFDVQDHVYVYTVDADGRARARRIVPRLRLADSFVVESGIGPGERFIAEGIQRVKDGEKVAIHSGPSTKAPAL